MGEHIFTLGPWTSRATAMRGKAISSGERKIIVNVFKHFKTENSSSNGNVITLTFKVPRIVKHGVKSPSKIGLTGRKNLTSWISSNWEWSGLQDESKNVSLFDAL